MNKTALLLAISALCAGQANAQSSDWEYNATLYGWFTGMTSSMDTQYGTINSSLSSKEVLSNVDAAFMFAFEARRGSWSLVLDGVYSKLSLSENTPIGGAFSEAQTNSTLTQVTGLALYRFYDSPSVKIDAGPGLRWFDVENTVTLTPGRLGFGQSTTSGESWVDPVLAARMIVPINDAWSATALVDFGGTGSDDKTWQALASVQYRFNEKWSAGFGYRTMDLTHDIGGVPNNINLSGPFIAAGFRF